jgi:hypothetical protein
MERKYNVSITDTDPLKTDDFRNILYFRALTANEYDSLFEIALKNHLYVIAEINTDETAV